MKSFFDRLTGSVNVEDEGEDFDEFKLEVSDENDKSEDSDWEEEEEEDGELSVDVYDDEDKIILKTMVAGVRPEDLDISITRDMVTIKGSRQEEKEVTRDNYFHKELYWGSFSRTIMLPTEVDIENSKATEKHGLLILDLPKVDKEKKASLKVKN
jgi:HSP20 family protein